MEQETKPKRKYNKKQKIEDKEIIIIKSKQFILTNATIQCNGELILNSNDNALTNTLNKLINNKSTANKIENNNNNNDNNDTKSILQKQIKDLKKKIAIKKMIYTDLCK